MPDWAIVEHLPVAVFVKRAGDGRYALWNRGYAELTGISAEEVLGRTDHDIFRRPRHRGVISPPSLSWSPGARRGKRVDQASRFFKPAPVL